MLVTSRLTRCCTCAGTRTFHSLQNSYLTSRPRTRHLIPESQNANHKRTLLKSVMVLTSGIRNEKTFAPETEMLIEDLRLQKASQTPRLRKPSKPVFQSDKDHEFGDETKFRQYSDNYSDSETDLLEMEAHQDRRPGGGSYNTFGKHHGGDKNRSNSKNYNYGLPGLGKRKHKKHEYDPMPMTSGEDVLFGLFPVYLSLTENRRTHCRLFMKSSLKTSTKPVIKKICDLAAEKDVPISYCSRGVLDQLAQDRPHQGVCLDTSRIQPVELDVEQLDSNLIVSSEGKPQVWLALDAVQDPMNFGAVLRTSYFMGVDRIIVETVNSCRLSPVVSKASAGALEVMDIHVVHDLPQLLQSLRAQEWTVYGTVGTDTAASDITPLNHVSVNNNTLIVMGNEGIGVRPEVGAYCSRLVSVPAFRQLHPGLESLNVSVATGVLLYHMMNSRQGGQA